MKIQFTSPFSSTAVTLLFFMLLLCSAIADIKTRRIPKLFSYTLLVFPFLQFFYDKQYLLAVFYVLSIIATGNKKIKLILYTAAVVIFANSGSASLPLIFGTAAADLLFSLRFIGGGDAQLLFALLGAGYKDWNMVVSIVLVILAAGIAATVYSTGLKNIGKRIVEIGVNLKRGTVESDVNRLKIPFAAFLPFAFLLSAFVSFQK
ncbi:MAG: hypothetical protein IJI41_05650 [Anaerolineaceae bacterium]|nr:hypothetical protein [Anaerolineaceae bacterium]